MHFVDFEVQREKGDFLKTTIGHLGLNRGSIKFCGSLFFLYRKTFFSDIIPGNKTHNFMEDFSEESDILIDKTYLCNV